VNNSRIAINLILIAGAACLLVMTGTAAHAASVSDAVKLFREGKIESAAQQLQQAVAAAPDDLQARFWLGRCKQARGDLEGAGAEFQVVLDKKPTSVESRYWLGVVRRDQGHVAEARGLFAKVLAVSPGHAEAKAALAEMERLLGEQAQGRMTDLVGPAGLNDRLGLQVSGLSITPGDVEILSDHVYDYTFADAPTDWTVATGIWEITNRWTCSPQWSWFGGYDNNGAACIWNKREFEGDVTVEIYLGFKMGVAKGNHSYRNPNDMNITICGDGANLDSGYSFMYGAQLNTSTRIMKGTEVLAENRDPSALLPIFEDGFPSTYQFHRKWWALRARKSGDLLQFWVDGKLVCETRDPDPLPRGRIAVWTRDNGLIISRVKVYYAQEKLPRDPTPTEHLKIRPVEQVHDRQMALNVPSHAALEDSFESDLGNWRNRGGAQGAMLTLAAPGSEGRGHCLKLINSHPGGEFSATIHEGSFNVRDLPQLSFDYLLSPDVKVNLYLTVRDQLYEIVFSGRSTPSAMAEILGAIGDVQADGKWHHATFDLLGHLESKLGSGAAVLARDLFIGNRNDAGYLDAGFGGNHAGAAYSIDNFRLDKPGGREITVAAKGRGSVKPVGYAFSLDRKPDTGPELKVTSEDGTATFTADADGVWYLHACPKLPDDTWGSVITRCIRVDNTAPTVVAVAPKGGILTNNDPITIRVSDGGGVGIDASSIKVRINDKEYGVDGEAVVYDPASESIRIAPSAVGLAFPQAGKVTVGLTAMADRNGLALAKPASWAFSGGPNTDRAAPEPPRVVVGDTPPICDDFETSLGEWEPWGGEGGAVLSLDDTTAARGKSSLQLYNTVSGGSFGAYIRKTSFDAGKYRLVRFFYKVPEHLRADFILYVNGSRKSVRFTDTDNQYTVIGEVPDVQADNEWHYAEFNLYEMLRRDAPDAPGYKVHQLLIADTGWTSNAPGQTYHIDDFEIVPVSSSAEPLKIAWTITDLSGLGGVNWALDENPYTELAKKAITNASYVECQNEAVDGWLHVRASDSAGHWSETAHQRVILDSSRPVATQISPAPNSRTAVSNITLGISDEGPAGVDPGSVILSVDGTDYSVSNNGLTYHSDDRELVWNCEQTSPQPVVFSDKQDVRVQLKQAADYAGNAVKDLPNWTWVMDYSKDTTAPQIASIECRTHQSWLTQTFETGTEGWRNRQGGMGAKVEQDTANAASGTASVKLTQQRAGGHMQAAITDQSFPAEKYPVIAFDYRFDKGVHLNLQLQMSGQWWAIAMTDSAKDTIGRIGGMRADGKWHHASVNVAPLLRRHRRRGALLVTAIIVGDRGNMETPVGATANFDNFVIGRVGSTNPVFRWKATDTTGITGYSYVLDQEPATVPPAESMGASVAKTFEGLEKGLWFLHLRACDGAGNWGPTDHYAIMHAGG